MSRITCVSRDWISTLQLQKASIVKIVLQLSPSIRQPSRNLVHHIASLVRNWCTNLEQLPLRLTCYRQVLRVTARCEIRSNCSALLREIQSKFGNGMRRAHVISAFVGLRHYFTSHSCRYFLLTVKEILINPSSPFDPPHCFTILTRLIACFALLPPLRPGKTYTSDAIK